jgi:hypothetical protein
VDAVPSKMLVGSRWEGPSEKVAVVGRVGGGGEGRGRSPKRLCVETVFA